MTAGLQLSCIQASRQSGRIKRKKKGRNPHTVLVCCVEHPTPLEGGWGPPVPNAGRWACPAFGGKIYSTSSTQRFHMSQLPLGRRDDWPTKNAGCAPKMNTKISQVTICCCVSTEWRRRLQSPPFRPPHKVLDQAATKLGMASTRKSGLMSNGVTKANVDLLLHLLWLDRSIPYVVPPAHPL